VPVNNYQPQTNQNNSVPSIPAQNNPANDSTTTTTTATSNTTIAGCQTLYWTDNNNKTCESSKQFCGSYMYQGLSTFGTQSQCLAGISTQQQVDTTNWKTYTNTGCGYSFQYPDSWSQWGNESNAINLQGGIMSRIVDFMDTASQGIERVDGSNNQIAAAKDHMHVECYTMGTSVYNDELSRYNNSSDVFAQNKKTITVAGQTAIIGEMKNTATVSGGAHPGRTVIPSHNIYVFFMHKDQTHALYFEFDTPLGNGDVAEIANFEQLLKTFNFTN